MADQPHEEIFWFQMFVVDSSDKQMQNEKELIRLANAKGGEGAIFYFCGEY